MDIYDYIKLDNEKFYGLMKQFYKTNSNLRKNEILSFLLQEMAIHNEAEKQVFYSFLKRFNQTKQHVLRSENEINEIEKEIKIIKQSLKNKPLSEITDEVNNLMTLIEVHRKDDENIIFKQAKKVIPLKETYALKERMHFFKQELKIDQDNLPFH